MFSNILYKQLSGNEYNGLNIDDNISATGMSFLFFSFQQSILLFYIKTNAGNAMYCI